MTPEMLKLQTDPIQRPLTTSIYINYGTAIQWDILWLQRINIPCSVQKDLQLFLVAYALAYLILPVSVFQL